MKRQLSEGIFERMASMPNEVGFREKNQEANLWVESSWSDIIDSVNNIALSLIKYGVDHQQKVGIFSQNSANWVRIDIAIMRIGAVTVPIYATSSKQQVEYLINDAEIKLLFVGDLDQLAIANEILEDKSTGLQRIILIDSHDIQGDLTMDLLSNFVETQFTELELQNYTKRIESVSPDDLATLIYTSGTTGEPKGVMLQHSNFIAAFRIHDKRLTNLDSSDHSLSFLPLSHVFERTWTLYCMHRGIKISFLSDPKKVVETLAEVKPTLFCTVPRVYEKVFNVVMNGVKASPKIKQKIFKWSIGVGKDYHQNMNLEKSSSVLLKFKYRIANALVLSKIKNALGGRIKMTPTAGAPLSAEIQAFMRAVGIPVTMGYGLTETCASVTAFTETKYAIGSAGKLMPELELKIGDNDEIMVKGPTVMKGYYKKQKETEEVFEGEWFKTGDAGRLDEQGNLFITDRIKDLMKTANGKYIAPQLIEALLTDDNYIEQAMVIGDERPFVTAFVVPNFEALKEYAKSLEIKFHTMEELISIPKVVEFYHQKLEELQKGLANFEKIKRFKLLPGEFTMEKGELTPTLKIRRKVIIKKFQNFVNELYNSENNIFKKN